MQSSRCSKRGCTALLYRDDDAIWRGGPPQSGEASPDAQEKLHFETIECYMDLKQVQVPPGSTVLLECLSNLTANELYDPAGAKEETVKAVLDGIRSLRSQAGTLILVSNEIFSDGVPYDDSMLQYLSYLGRINREAAALADRVTEVVYGIPVPIKEKRQPERAKQYDKKTYEQLWHRVFHVFENSNAAVRLDR